MHPLKQYLQDVKEPAQDFATRVGASRQTLYRLMNGLHTPRPALARRIVEATGGEVTFEALYAGKHDDRGAVIDYCSEFDEPLIDQARLRLPLEVVINHLLPVEQHRPGSEVIDVAAEAVVNTYAALSKVTTRQGPERLSQALRPVLEEILREYLQTPHSPVELERGVDLAVQLYFQDWRPGRPSSKER